MRAPWADFTALLPPKVRAVQRVGLARVAGRAPPGFFLSEVSPPVRCRGSSPQLLPRAWACDRSAGLPRRSARLPRHGVSLAQVVA